MKRIALLLVALLTALCGLSCTAPATKRQVAAEDVEYNQALEFYTLTRGQGMDPNRPADPRQPGSSARMDADTLARIRDLDRAVRAWRQETPDKHVAAKDRKEVRQILEDFFDDPLARQRMVVKTWELDMCHEVATQFHNKNRCVVSVMFYNRGPKAQAGLDLYLFKHEGQWRIVHRVDWIA